MNRAAGTDRWRVVGARAGLDRREVLPMAAGLIDRSVLRRGRPRRAEAGGRDTQGLEQPSLHQLLPRRARDLLGHRAGDGEARVRVEEPGPGLVNRWERDDALDELHPLLCWRAVALHEPAPEAARV